MLGIDIGTTAVRIAEARRTQNGHTIRAVAVREVPPGLDMENADVAHLAAIVEDAAQELRTSERRCVCAVGEPDALLRPVKFPKMSAAERTRAARFEVEKDRGFDASATARVHGDEKSGWVLGIARTGVLSTRAAIMKAAGLRAVAIDHEAYALLRAFPDYDGVLDIGERRSCLHMRSVPAPRTYVALCGGATVTSGIESDIGVDRRTAEKRKRILGTAGAGENAKRDLFAATMSLLTRFAAPSRARVALTGNGSRLCGLAEELAQATSLQIEIAVPPSLGAPAYPCDVARAAAPDWSLATGLALWNAA